MSNNIAVGLGEIKISKDPGDVLVAYGLGSCVAVGMYDPIANVGGLLHAVLPANSDHAEPVPSKYVDSGIDILIKELETRGAKKQRMVVRIAGGANMLVAPGFSDTFNIGNRNINSAESVLGGLRLQIKGKEVGGTIGRTVRLYIENGRMTVRSMGQPEREF